MQTAAHHHVRRTLAAAMTAAMIMALLVLAAPPAAAQITYTVDLGHMTGASAVDDPVPDGCDPGDCSLREAVVDANASPGADVITFEGPGAISLSQISITENENTHDLDITDDVEILGVGDTVSITPGEMNFSEERVFDIDDSTVVIEDIVFFDGVNNDSGGAIRMQGDADLTVRRSTFRNNQASQRGGAISQLGGSLLVQDSLFVGNNANNLGGAIFVRDPEAHRIEGSTFTENSAGVYCCEGTGAIGQGGAIYYLQESSRALAEIDATTFTGNFAQNGNAAGASLPGGEGGAIYSNNAPLRISNSAFDGNGSDLTTFGGAIRMSQFSDDNDSTINNTTFIDNQATQTGGAILVDSRTALRVDQSAFSENLTTGTDGSAGGAIWIGGMESEVDVVNTTISDNQSVLGAAIHIDADEIDLRRRQVGQQVDGTELRLGHVTLVDNAGRAGIYSQSANATIESRSTIVANNTQLNCFAPDPAVFVSLDYNVEDRNDCPFNQPNDQFDTDPTLGPLADNAGQAQGADADYVGQTHALLDGSPAIDTADPGFCPDPVETDQRLVTRPQGPLCDVGAYEAVQAFDIAVDKSVSPASVDTSTESTFTIEVTNPSPSQDGSVILTDVVPDGLTIGTVTTSAGTCDPPAGQTITCDLGTVAVGDTVTITITVTGTAAGSYTNTATIDVDGGEGDDNPDNDSSDATLLVIVDQVLCSGGVDTNGDTIIGDGITRIEGLNRIQTAIAASQAACGPGEAPAVVLTRADLFPDAQAGTPLAVELGAPLLLSDPATLSPDTETEIERILLPGGTVYLLGGEVALSAAVDQRLNDLGYSTIRYGGQNRFGTAAIIADDGLNNPPNLLMANGGDFADSIVAGAAAINVVPGSPTVQAAVLLTSDVNVPPETQAYLDGLAGPAPTIISIGADAGLAFPAAEGVSGPTRFETAVAVAERFFTAPTAVGIARADDFPDGLTGGALMGRQLVGPGPILLTATDALPTAVDSYLQANAGSIERTLIFGGFVAVDANVQTQIEAALGL